MTCSLGSEGSHLEHTGRGCISTGITSPRSTRGAVPSTGDDFPTLFPLETSERSTVQRLWPTPRSEDSQCAGDRGIADTLHSAVKDGSSPAASPARISPSLVRVPGSKGFARDCGLSTRGSLARYDRATRSWRTSARSLDGDLIEFSGALPKSGTMRSGVIYELPTSERRTAGSASGSWPTPDANTSTYSNHHNGFINLREAVQTRERNPFIKYGEEPSNEAWEWENEHNPPKTGGPIWPTPTSRDHKDGCNVANVPENGLLGRVVKPTPETGSLSPEFVEWLMGYSPGWTDSADSETRLSLRSPR